MSQIKIIKKKTSAITFSRRAPKHACFFVSEAVTSIYLILIRVEKVCLVLCGAVCCGGLWGCFEFFICMDYDIPFIAGIVCTYFKYNSYNISIFSLLQQQSKSVCRIQNTNWHRKLSYMSYIYTTKCVIFGRSQWVYPASSNCKIRFCRTGWISPYVLTAVSCWIYIWYYTRCKAWEQDEILSAHFGLRCTRKKCHLTNAFWILSLVPDVPDMYYMTQNAHWLNQTFAFSA